MLLGFKPWNQSFNSAITFRLSALGLEKTESNLLSCLLGGFCIGKTVGLKR